ncbi:hypothetical protein DR088_02400 [Mycoplasma hyopneumoniae]|nr:hypothetical protein [Mesomycoplasma hyopneumoniae]MXR33739.1 hypothetical protein [Mesomycoplasma hyopneumoniae]MXR64078.1 hypothetical protein [Mesomycoplasma hyopneumoniae]
MKKFDKNFTKIKILGLNFKILIFVLVYVKLWKKPRSCRALKKFRIFLVEQKIYAIISSTKFKGWDDESKSGEI